MENDRSKGNELTELRAKIDTTDRQVITALAQRFMIVQEVGEFKRSCGIPPLDESRWQKVIEDRIRLAEDMGLPVELIVDIFELIHTHSLKEQETKE